MLLRNSFLTIAVVLLASSKALAGPIYVYKEPDGVIRFSTNLPPKGVQAKVYTAKNSKFSYYRVSASYARGSYNWSYRSRKLYTRHYGDIISLASKYSGVDEPLIRAVIHAESSFNPHAVSPKGAMGLMQLMRCNVRLFRVNNPFSPYENVKAGTKLLSKLLKKYSGNKKLALAAYNAGEEAVKKHKGIPPYRETQNYIVKVLALEQKYITAINS